MIIALEYMSTWIYITTYLKLLLSNRERPAPLSDEIAFVNAITCASVFSSDQVIRQNDWKYWGGNTVNNNKENNVKLFFILLQLILVYRNSAYSGVSCNLEGWK